MRNTRLLVLCGAVMIGIAGCNREAADTDMAATTPVEPTPVPAVTPPPPTPSTLTMATGGMGSYIADNSGRAMYVLEGDDTGAKCMGDCIKAWPPVLAAPTGAPAAASSSVQTAMIGIIQRDDGSQQVTYNGHPLYYYAEDVDPGTTKGHDMVDTWGEWYLVGPTGLAMDDKDAGDTAVTGEAAADEPTAPAATDTDMPTDKEKEADTQPDTEKKDASDY